MFFGTVAWKSNSGFGSGVDSKFFTLPVVTVLASVHAGLSVEWGGLSVHLKHRYFSPALDGWALWTWQPGATHDGSTSSGLRTHPDTPVNRTAAWPSQAGTRLLEGKTQPLRAEKRLSLGGWTEAVPRLLGQWVEGTAEQGRAGPRAPEQRLTLATLDLTSA